MTLMFGVASNHPAATVSGRIAYIFATQPKVETVVVWRGRMGKISVRAASGREIPTERLIGIYTRGVTIDQVCQDVNT